MRRFRAHAPAPIQPALSGGVAARRPFQGPGPATDRPSSLEPNINQSGSAPSATRQGGRLNLLLSFGGWRPDSWADNIECLLRPHGVEAMRARTARQAEQVIRSRPIHIAVVDLGLPLDAPQGACHHHDEAGCRVLDLLRRLDAPPPTVIVRSTRAARDAARDLNAALRFDAFAVVDRTSADVELMLKILQRCMERFYQGRWPAQPKP